MTFPATVAAAGFSVLQRLEQGCGMAILAMFIKTMGGSPWHFTAHPGGA